LKFKIFQFTYEAFAARRPGRTRAIVPFHPKVPILPAAGPGSGLVYPQTSGNFGVLYPVPLPGLPPLTGISGPVPKPAGSSKSPRKEYQLTEKVLFLSEQLYESYCMTH